MATLHALTFLNTGAISFAMREALMKRLAVAVLLLAAGMFAPTGSASAHQGHASSPAIHSPTAQKAPASDSNGDAQSAGRVGNESFVAASDHGHDRRGPCSEDSGQGHMSGCCTVACHAALEAAVPTVWPRREPIAHGDAWPTEVLAGLSGYRTERPPKRA